MTYKICYWDVEAQEQRVRDATAEEAYELDARKIAPVPVPQMVTMKQARLALFQEGYLNQIQPVIDGLSDPIKTEALIQWEYSTTVERDNQFCTLLGTEIGLTDTQIDDLFRLAITL